MFCLFVLLQEMKKLVNYIGLTKTDLIHLLRSLSLKEEELFWKVLVASCGLRVMTAEECRGLCRINYCFLAHELPSCQSSFFIIVYVCVYVCLCVCSYLDDAGGRQRMQVVLIDGESLLLTLS